jgi:rubrerythrin
MELKARLHDLPADRDLVFYCSSGPRAEIAAVLAAEAELSDRPIFLLVGGMLAWDGHKLPDFPRVQTFDQARSLADLLTTAMDLEKGAYRYYGALLERFGHLSFHSTLAHLAKAEEAHARMLFALRQTEQPDAQSFEAVFEALPGEILEGGQPFGEVLARLEVMSVANGIPLLEYSLGIEYRAYDLYRNMAERAAEERTRNHLLAIAQAEKTHMRQLTEAIAALA